MLEHRSVTRAMMLAAMAAVLAMVALSLTAVSAGAGSEPDALVIELSPSNGKAGTEVTVKIADDECVAETTGVFAVNAGAPDDPELATVAFPDPNNGSFTVPDLEGEYAGAPTAVLVECVDAAEQTRSGEAAWDYDMPYNQFTIVKEVSNPEGSAQVFGFAIVGPTDSPEPNVNSLDVFFALSDGGAEDDSWVMAGENGPGTFTVSEAETPGWGLESITCDDDSAVVDIEGRTVSFVNDDPDYKITCTFLNSETEVAPKTETAPAPAAVAGASEVRYTG